MRFFSTAAVALLATGQYVAAFPGAKHHPPPPGHEHKIAPKVMIVSLFAPEADVWYDNLPDSGLGDLMAHNITTPGLSMLFPHIHCVEDYSICQMTTGESEINAASTVMAAVLSSKFDLTKTYFMIAGIAGVNPKYGTLGGVALGRYSVQVALQYEFDARDMPANFSTGYFGYGTEFPDIYPGNQYGTEVLELSETLRDLVFGFASKANLTDGTDAQAYRARYVAAGDVYAAGAAAPAVVKCDSATSDVYYSGTLLGEAFEEVTKVWTNGSGVYCMTAQEDSAVLEVLVRAAIEGVVDFSRAILMRTASDFDRPPPGVSALQNLRILEQGGYSIAIDNIYNAGVEIVKGILADWDCTFAKGVKPENYIGDIFGSLGGDPDFGPGSLTDGDGYLPNGGSGDLFRRGQNLAPRSSKAKAMQQRAEAAKRGVVARRAVEQK